MPKEAIGRNRKWPLDPLEVERLKDQVLELSNRISALAKGYHGPIEDVALAQEMAQAAKPYIDRLIALNRLLNPIDRLVGQTRADPAIPGQLRPPNRQTRTGPAIPVRGR